MRRWDMMWQLVRVVGLPVGHRRLSECEGVRAVSVSMVIILPLLLSNGRWALHATPSPLTCCTGILFHATEMFSVATLCIDSWEADRANLQISWMLILLVAAHLVEHPTGFCPWLRHGGCWQFLLEFHPAYTHPSSDCLVSRILRSCMPH